MDPVQMHHSFINTVTKHDLGHSSKIPFFRIGSIIKAKDLSLRYGPMKY